MRYKDPKDHIHLLYVTDASADHASRLSASEHERDVTPSLRELVAARDIVFAEAISRAPWTLPAFASMFTGPCPERHGAEQHWQKLPASQLTLAEILREAGYRKRSRPGTFSLRIRFPRVKCSFRSVGSRQSSLATMAMTGRPTQSDLNSASSPILGASQHKEYQRSPRIL